MSAPPIVHRVKLLVASRGTAIAAALLVVGLVAFAGAAWTVTHPPSVEVTEQIATHTVGTDVTTSTVVTGNTSLWERGTTLEDKPLYPLQSAPRLTVDMRTTVPVDQEVRVDQELTLVYRATKDGEVFWESDRLLVSEDRTVSDGEARAVATFDVRQVRDHLDEINQEITGIGRAQAFLRLNVTYQTDDYSGSLSKTAPVTVMNTGYWVGGELDTQNTHQSPVTRESSQPPETGKALGLALLGMLALGGAGGVVFLSSGRLDAEAIADELDRQRYREWVSAGRLGQFVSGQDVAMDSLQDLVDVAIDSNNRVVHDTQRELYAVITGDVIYYYDPFHPEPEIDFEPEVDVPLQYDGGHHSSFADGPRPPQGSDGPGPAAADSQPVGGVAAAEPTADAPDDIPAEPAELPTESVSVARTVAHEDGRLVVTYRLETDEPDFVIADVADRLVDACEHVDSLRPLAGDEPAETIGIEGGVGFRELVSASASREVTYVVGTDAPATDDVLDAVRGTPGPRVRRAVPVDPRSDR